MIFPVKNLPLLRRKVGETFFHGSEMTAKASESATNEGNSFFNEVAFKTFAKDFKEFAEFLSGLQEETGRHRKGQGFSVFGIGSLKPVGKVSRKVPRQIKAIQYHQLISESSVLAYEMLLTHLSLNNLFH